MGKLATVAGVAVAAGLAVGLKKSVESAVDFERAMRNVNSIAGLSEKQFGNLGKSVLSMAANVGQKPKVLADGLYDIVSSGFKANDAIKILAVSARAATAGMTDTATASKAVTAALNAYHLGADEAREVSDVLFQTVNKGVLTFEELSQQMGDLVPASAPLGVSLKEVGAGMATLTLQGVPAAEAATRMKNVMLSLAKPTPALTKLLKEQGFASGEAAVKQKGLAGVLEILSAATKGSVSETAKLTPEIRTLLGAVGLTGKNLKTYTEILASMDEATKNAGITQRVFAEQSKSVAVQWQKVNSALDVLKIQIGNALLPALKAALGGVSRFLAELNKADGISAKLDVVWDRIKSGLKSVGEGLATFGSMLGAKLASAVAGIDWSVVWGKAQGIGEGLAARLASVNWAAVGAAIGDGIGTAIQTHAQIAQKLAGAVNQAMRTIDWSALGRAAGPGLATAMVVAFTTLTDPSFWIKNWDLALSVALVAFGGGIGKIAGKIGVMLGATLGRAFEAGVIAIASILERVSPRLATAVMSGLLKLPALVASLFGKLSGVVTTAFAKLSAISRFVVKVIGVDAVIQSIAKLVSAVVSKFVSAAQAIAAQLAQWRAAARSLAIGAVNAIIEFLGTLAGKVRGQVGKIPGVLLGLVPAVIVAAVAIGRALTDGVISGIGDIGGRIFNAAKGGLMSAVSRLKSIADIRSPSGLTSEQIGKPLGQGIIAGWGTALDQGIPQVLAAFERTFAAAKSAVTRAAEVLGGAFEKFGGYVERAFGARTQQYMSALATAFDVQISKVRAWAAELTSGERALAAFQNTMSQGQTASEMELAALDKGESQRGRDSSLAAAQAALAAANAMPSEDPGKVSALADAKTDLATAERKLSEARAKGAVDLASYEKAVREGGQRVAALELEQSSGRAAAIMAAEEQLRVAQLGMTRARLEEQAAAEREARDAANAAQLAALQQTAAQERTARDAEAAERIAAFELQKTAELANLEEFRRIQGEQMTKKLGELQKYLAEHPKKWKATQAAVIKLLAGYGVEMRNSGVLLGNAFANGLASAEAAVEKAAVKLATAAAKQLQLRSPAKEGPLSTLDKWWKPMGPMLAKQMDGSAIASAASRMAAGAVGGASGGPRMAMAGGSGGGNTYNIYASTTYGDDQSVQRLVGKIRQEIQRGTARNG